MARTKKVSASSAGAYKHQTSIGEHGEILYHCPIEIKDKADMANYGISNDDCRYMHFGTSEKIRAYYFKTTNRAFAEYQWKYLNDKHSSGYFQSRCMVPGKRKAFIRCRDTNKCTACPYGITPETRQAATVSLDGLIASGWEPAPAMSVERQVMAKIEREEIRARMDAEDPRIGEAYEGKVFSGTPVKDIAENLGVSQPRVYQLVNRAKEIIREYQEEANNV